MFQGLGRFTGRRPAVVALASGGLMVALALGVFGMRWDYDQTGQLPSDTESARGLDDLRSGFPAGALNPTTVYVRSDSGQRLDRRPWTSTPTSSRVPPGSAASCRPGRTAAWSG